MKETVRIVLIVILYGVMLILIGMAIGMIIGIGIGIDINNNDIDYQPIKITVEKTLPTGTTAIQTYNEHYKNQAAIVYKDDLVYIYVKLQDGRELFWPNDRNRVIVVADYKENHDD